MGFGELADSSYEFGIFATGADGYSQTVIAKSDASAVADDDAFLDEIVVDRLSVVHLGQEEIGVGGINPLTDRQVAESFNHMCPLH